MKKPVKSFFKSDKEYIKKLESYIDYLENYTVEETIEIDISSIHNTPLERSFFYWLKNEGIYWATNYNLNKLNIYVKDFDKIKKTWTEIKKC